MNGDVSQSGGIVENIVVIAISRAAGTKELAIDRVVDQNEAGPIPTIRTNYLLLKNVEISGLQISDYRKRRPAAPRWRRESRANPSLNSPNSLLAGKIQGISGIRAQMGPKFHLIGLTPIKILAGTGSLGLPNDMPVVMGGSCWATAKPNEPKVRTRSATKLASVPLIAIPAMILPRAEMDIRLSSNCNRATLKARINCSPKAAASISSAYDEIVIGSPPRRRTETKLSICGIVSRRGAICLSKSKFIALNSSASLSRTAARSLALPAASVARAAVAFASSLRVLASAIRWSASFWVASVISYPIHAEMNADATPMPPKTSAEMVAHLNTASHSGAVNVHIPLSFWALLFFVVSVLLCTAGSVCLVIKAFRCRSKNVF